MSEPTTHHPARPTGNGHHGNGHTTHGHGGNGKPGQDRPEPELTYHIGTVANLTGLNADTIRAWERRYEAIVPRRSEGGSRLYNDSDVERLQLLKAVTDLGEPIGTIAGRSDDELRALLARFVGADGAGPASDPEPAASPIPSATPGQRLRLGLLSDPVSRQLEASPEHLKRFELVFRAASPASFLEALPSLEADLLLLDISALGEDPIPTFEAAQKHAGTGLVAVLYRFARREELARLSEAGAKLIQGPLALAQLDRTLYDLFLIDQAFRHQPAGLEDLTEGPLPPHRFSRDQLARLLELEGSVDCECPNHLAGIIAKLAAFEDYSTTCKDDDPGQAELHALLARGTAQARTLMERLLLQVCETDGIEI